jgi:hypothetical protein
MWWYVAGAVTASGFIALPKLVALFRAPPDKLPEVARAVFGRPEPPHIEPRDKSAGAA